ncbi:hypothetical protein AZI86_08730 [Bdellovibrio bacteriovorus]|uniref:Uncharacterized protein n=1 Tax=Bdellovibrio bacteriovorus TaxID=959 RepID=A0A150WRS9_BDEBC|nr:DUF5819 family protein [Bdellovibrio bacteriovorus]KYG67086.1 hypothetical protein AZI86_08730 [Bdellovibrio bacteriovorus]
MNTYYLNAMKVTLLGILGIHLSMHVLYLAPANPATYQYSEMVDTYMNSFFSQNWHLFAPEPATSSLQLAYRCNNLQNWKLPIDGLLSEHKSWPITAKGKKTYVLQNLAREIYNAKLLQKEDAQIPELPLLKKFLHDQCGRYALSEVQIKRTFTTNYSQRFTAPKGSDEVYEFRMQQDGMVWN